MTTVPAHQRLPDIPNVANWAAALLILSGIPWAYQAYLDRQNSDGSFR
ncbi:MAG: hypothetical protein ACRDUV_10410 [Pseudonocardiaceae bacterium]